jgi:diguanylate cyclase (GGDEF)-like protein/PAS domain S-box-containing protein
MYISIKWKAFVFISILLILLSIAWIWQTTSKTLEIHQTALQEKANIQKNILNKILDDRYQQLSPIIQIIPMHDKISPLLNQSKVPVKELQSHLEELWFQLNFNMGADYLGIYDKHFNNLAFEYNPETILAIAKYNNVLEKRLQNKNRILPDQFIYCDQGCMQVVIEPVIFEDGRLFYTAVGQSLSYLTQLFSSLSNDKLGILLTTSKTPHYDNSDRYINEWDQKLWALSDFDKNYAIIKAFSDKHLLDYNGTNITWKSQIFRVQRFTIDKVDFLGIRPDIFVIRDETQTYKLLNESILNGGFIGVIALILSEIMLLLFIMNPIKRLINISQALTFLPKLEYKKARGMVSNHTSFVCDEMTSLESNTHLITNQLEYLHNEVENKIQVLDRSRSFLTRLLDNTQLFIVTQDFNNIILSRNEKMNEILSKETAVFTHCTSANDAMTLHNSLDSLKTNHQQITYHEGHSFDNNGNEIYIAWTHTMVDDEQGQHVVLSIGTDLTKRKEAERALTWIANNDPLTGINNRRGFQLKIEELIADDAHFSLVFIDVNRFKQINDIYGHSTGDEVLVCIASRLKSVTRQTDHISRLAGDEFTILLTRTSLNELEAALIKITTALQGEIKIAEQQIVEFGTSLGAAVYPTHTTDSDTLVIYADMAMYLAKKKEDAHWHIFREEDKQLDILKKEHQYSELIREATKNNYFKLVFQPIKNLQVDEIHHYEVLLRIELPNGQTVFPDEFIPIAEKNGLIRDIDHWVIEHALDILSKQQAENPNLTFGINVSAPTLQSSSFPELIRSHIKKYQVPATHVVIELTETAYIENFNQALENLKSLDEMGVKVALDDFGVGFSSFSYLKRLPLSYVKLDGSYIKNLCGNKDDQIFVKCLSEMVSAFGMSTIAEFVEDEETLQLLKQLGVHYVQGYHIGKPGAII